MLRLIGCRRYSGPVAVWTPWSVGAPDWTAGPLVDGAVAGVLQAAMLVAFFVMSLIIGGHRLTLRSYADRAVASRALIPLVALSLLFTVAGLLLLQQPMGARHGM